MPDELGSFQTAGISWAHRAECGELNAVLSPTGSAHRNRFLHNMQMFGAGKVPWPRISDPVVVDFGCGTGRFLRLFGQRTRLIVGTEITKEMLCAARGYGLPDTASLLLTDGVSLPLRDESVDLIWCCGVLRFSLFVPNPAYAQIAKEMFRVLKPGGRVVNYEMYVDVGPDVFVRDFETAGFKTTETRVLNRHFSRMEQALQSRRLPLRAIALTAGLCATIRYYFDSPTRSTGGLRDYMFVWLKDGCASQSVSA
jgi:ubiquinone/menaquinone biosynthesis C-methylase UbiE